MDQKDSNARPATGAHLREQMQQKLTDEGAEDLAEKLEKCAELMTIVCTGCGATKRIETRCKQRWCPVCAVKLSLTRIRRYEQAAARCQWPLMLTLTCKNTNDASRAAPTILKAFTRFRRTVFWKQTVKGGVASFECTNRGRGWHPHLHCLLDARWLAVHTQEPRHTDSTETKRHKLRSAQRELSQLWAAALGQTSAIVHVRRAFGDHLRETLKYNLKPSDLIECEEPIAPLLRALKGKRLVIPFGTFYGMGAAWKDEDNDRKEQCKCPECQATRSYLPAAATHQMISRPMSKYHGTIAA